MNKLFVPLAFLIVFPISISKADMTGMGQAPIILQPIIIKASEFKSVPTKSEVDSNKGSVLPIKASSLQFKIIVDEIVKRNPTASPISEALSRNNIMINEKPVGLLLNVTPGYSINRNFLSLTKIDMGRRKASLMFVFVMNKPTNDAKKKEDHFNTVAKKSPRSRLHILGPKRLMPEQEVIDDEYPVDVSVAKYDDGYSPREWNFVLPNKKPREIAVSLLWSF